MKRIIFILSLLVLVSPSAISQNAATPAPGISAPEPVPPLAPALPAPVSDEPLSQKQKQLKQLEKQLDDLRKQIDKQRRVETRNVVLSTPRSTNRSSGQRMSGIMYGSMFNSSPDLLVVPAAASKTQEIAEIQEDMRIMARILENELKEFDLVKPHVWPIGQGRHSIEGLYLDGYGLVFELQVEFPLVSQGEEEKQDDEEEPVDKVWHQTKREIYAPDRGRHEDKNKEEDYDAEKVVELKETVAQILKHATNIRSLKADECVTIIVTSQKDTGNNRLMYSAGDGMSGYGGGYGVGVGSGYGMMGNMAGSGSTKAISVLAIKASKSNIDAYATEEMDSKQFQTELQVTLY